jgi:hypothetical protein
VKYTAVNFEIDPMTEHKIMMQCADNPKFAQIIQTNINPQMYGYIQYKVRMRENLNLAIKGETRSGKSTVAISLGTYVSSMTLVPYTIEEICANESEYYSKVKYAKFNQFFHIDEQKESKFGSGSFREEMGIMDIQNIIAKQCVHSVWIYPNDFISRNSVYGFETYGKDLKNKLIRCIVYDLRKTILGMMKPLGYCIFAKYQDPAYQNIPENEWSQYRLDNKYKLQRMDFDSLLEEQYEQKKDMWIKKEQTRDTGYHHEERFKLGVWLKDQELFQEQTSRKKQIIIARQLFRDLTEKEVEEIVDIARMGIDISDIEGAHKKWLKDEGIDEKNTNSEE